MPDHFQSIDIFNVALAWIGFGTLIGLLGHAILPNRTSDGPIAMILTGIVGAILACAGLKLLYPSQILLPISTNGIFVALTCSLVAITLYKFVGIYWLNERKRQVTRMSRRRRKKRFDAMISGE